MVESIFAFKNGVMVDLHYLIAIQSEACGYYVNFHYQLMPAPAKLAVGNGRGSIERKQDLEECIKAWKAYKAKQGR